MVDFWMAWATARLKVGGGGGGRPFDLRLLHSSTFTHSLPLYNTSLSD